LGVRLPESSIQGLETPSEGRVSVWARRLVLTLILAIVLAGASGALGVRSGEVEASEAGWSVRLEYAETARAGLDVPWQVTVTHAGGFQGDVELAVTGSYFDIYETQGFHPQPSDESRDGDTLYLTFAPPDSGDTMVVAYDAYIQPASQVGRSGTISVVDAGQRVASARFGTRLLP
jgi:hypothetical protein